MLFKKLVIIMDNIPQIEVFFTHGIFARRKAVRTGKTMNQDIQQFIQYLHEEKKTSENTEVSYERDLKKMSAYLNRRGICKADGVDSACLSAYVEHLEGQGLKPATVSRSIASMKAFFHYEELLQRIVRDPASELKAPKVEKKTPTVLNAVEIERLLAQPVGNTPKELRDKAMLELLYATDIRVSELVALLVADVDEENRTVFCRDAHRERVIQVEGDAWNALERYLRDGRPKMVEGEEVPWLFTNCSGQSMSRQGFWKLIKAYGRKAGIQSEITPHMLKHSFAAHLVCTGTGVDTVSEMINFPMN